MSAQLKKRVDSVLSLIKQPSLKGVESVFAAVFLKQVKPEILTAMFGRVAKEAGRCQFDRVERLMGANGAVVRLVCDNARAQLLVGIEDKPPHRIAGFSIKPLPK